MKVFPLAIYTADHGLAWNYPRSEISFQEIDACRKAFGPLPDFDAGSKGYSGVWAVGDRVFIMRCQSVQAWDFRGRDATYLAVTWIPRAEAAVTDFERILSSAPISVPNKTPPPFFELEAAKSRVDPVAAQPYLNDGFERIGGIIAGADPNQKIAAKRMDGASQVSCIVTGNRDARTGLSGNSPVNVRQDDSKPQIQQALPVPFIIAAAISILAIGASVILGMKSFYLARENAELKIRLAKAEEEIRPRNVFEDEHLKRCGTDFFSGQFCEPFGIPVGGFLHGQRVIIYQY